MCKPRKGSLETKDPIPIPILNILLTNGRFPVSIDLARQLHLAHHNVYVVDPMHYHVCKFSRVVRKSYYVPAPHSDSAGYITAVKDAILDAKIDLVIPMHEEIFYLAGCREEEILRRLLAPPFATLIMLHNKWEFSHFLLRIGLDTPAASLCRSIEDVRALDCTKELALKPVFGRGSSNVHHLVPGKPQPENIPVSPDNHFIAQDWIHGARFCSYSVLRNGAVRAFAVYPVRDTIDGSSAVYFTSIPHPRIRAYVEQIAAALPHVTGQLALDFVETAERLVAIECNPRATSGIHLFSRTPDLARAITDPSPHLRSAEALPGYTRQLMPGMLMWAHKGQGTRAWAAHMKRLVRSKDVLFSARDVAPSLMQPFLLTSYYKICQERRMRLPEMFQWDLTWEPVGEEMELVRRRLKEELIEQGGRGDVVGERVGVGGEGGGEEVNLGG